MNARVNGPTDAGLLDEARRIVRESVPGAVALLLATSDQQQGYGFTLTDVRLAAGQLLSDVDPTALVWVRDDTHEALCDLDWDGAVGEDQHGNAEVPTS